MDLQQLPPLTAFRAFAAAAQAGSVVGAADRLNVTHSAVSHQLRLIESWLGCKLFERHAAGVTLTDAGRRLFASTARALDDVGQVCAEIRGQRPATALTLACPGSFMLQWLIPRLDDFEARHPQVAAPLGFVPSGDRISLCVLRRRAQEPAIAALADWLGTLHGQPATG